MEIHFFHLFYAWYCVSVKIIPVTYPSPSPFPFGSHNFIFYVCGSVFVVWISPVVLLLASPSKWWLFFSTWIAQYAHRLVANVIVSRVVFLWFSSIPLCVSVHCTFIHPSADGHVGCVHVLLLGTVLLQTLGCMCLSKLEFSPFLNACPAGSYGSTVFNFLRSLHTVLHSGQTDSEKEITLVRFLWVFWQCGQILDGGNLRKFNSRGMEIK